MSRTQAALVCGCLVFGAAIAVRGQGHAGEVDPAKVWIQNRGAAQAVPVTIEATSPERAPQDAAGATRKVVVSEMVPVRRARQPWEYQAVTVAAGQDVVALLTNAGRDGWEVSGVQLPSAAGMTIILKRPR